MGGSSPEDTTTTEDSEPLAWKEEAQKADAAAVEVGLRTSPSLCCTDAFY